jgi:hypothetical protein
MVAQGNQSRRDRAERPQLAVTPFKNRRSSTRARCAMRDVNERPECIVSLCLRRARPTAASAGAEGAEPGRSKAGPSGALAPAACSQLGNLTSIWLRASRSDGVSPPLCLVQSAGQMHRRQRMHPKPSSDCVLFGALQAAQTLASQTPSPAHPSFTPPSRALCYIPVGGGPQGNSELLSAPRPTPRPSAPQLPAARRRERQDLAPDVVPDLPDRVDGLPVGVRDLPVQDLDAGDCVHGRVGVGEGRGAGQGWRVGMGGMA